MTSHRVRGALRSVVVVLTTCAWLSGCFISTRVEHETVRGTPRVIDRPLSGSPYLAETSVTDRGVGLRLVPVECSSYTETPITSRDVTYRKHTWATALVGAVIGGGLGALGYVMWDNSKKLPSECPPDDPKCGTKGGAKAGAIVMWGLGAGAIGYGTYLALKPESRSEGPASETIDRTEPEKHACGTSLSGVQVALQLPLDGVKLQGVTDGSGQAFFALPDELLARLYRSSRATFWIDSRQVGEVALSEPYRGWQARAGSRFGNLTYNDLVASSGSFSGSEAAVEVAVSPRDHSNAFVGAVLPEESFRFEGVQLSTLDGGERFPVALSVARVDVARPGDRSRDVIVLLDSSGSMRGNDGSRSGRVEGARAVFDELKDDTQVAVLDFGAGAGQGMRSAKTLQAFTTDDGALRKSLDGISESGGTPMYNAILDAMELLKARSGTGTIVVLTDGQAEDRGAHRKVIERANDQGVTLFTVGLGRSLDFPQLRELGVATGGGFAEAGDAKKLIAAFRGVGIGLAHGRVRVFGKGSFDAAPKGGRYTVSGKLLTLDPNTQRALESPFEFQTQL